VRILLVDDYEATCASLVDYLLLTGHDGECAFGAAEALQKLRGGAYDAAVLDHLLPDGTGLGVLREMRADPALALMPVVVMTAINAREADLICKELDSLQPASLMRKPSGPDELLAELKRLRGDA
jgi:CheY-like chemotaxis protein